MILEELGIPLGKVRGVGPSSIRQLSALGLRTVRDLLLHVPRGYENRQDMVGFAEALKRRGADEATWVCTVATVVDHDLTGRVDRPLLKIRVRDWGGEAQLVCFGRAFLAEKLPPGVTIAVCGMASYNFSQLQLSNFDFDYLPSGFTGELPRTEKFGYLLPVYPLAQNLTQGFFRRVIDYCLQNYAKSLEDPLPESIRELAGLMPRADALRSIHLPSSPETASDARRRLAWEELFFMQVALSRTSLARRKSTKPPTDYSPSPGSLEARLVASLPFSLTRAQQQALAEIGDDLGSGSIMLRLVQGDVGCGKTLVALCAALKVLEKRQQAVILVPTVLLAKQHAANASRMLEPLGVNIALLAGTIPAAQRKLLLQAVERGDVQLVIGTHGLFSESVQYLDLGLVIVDEQHRFGVSQRQALVAKARNPHQLLLSATPIPQTLALTVFGDMEITSIRELPAGRKPIETHLARMGNETKVYEWIRRELAKGRQAYFVYPLINEVEQDEGEETKELKNAESMFRRLSDEVFPGVKVGMIHAKLDEPAKEAAMRAFVAGEISILVATSVVEVGVDVPNATCMVIEHAERFGLAALHQLRGRVGRGSQQSFCFLVYQDPLSEESKRRIMVMKETNDGFRIAEEDLALRGPGDLRGLRQSGFVKLRVADLSRDLDLMKEAKQAAVYLLEQDPALASEPLLAKRLGFEEEDAS